ERFTAAVLEAVNRKPERVVFMLWGASARKKRTLIDTARHVIIESAHPSPLSARNGFFGSRPFSRANQALIAAGREPVDWSIPARTPAAVIPGDPPAPRSTPGDTPPPPPPPAAPP